MSEVWLLLAVGCLFFAIVLVGYFVDQTLVEHLRAVRLLESPASRTRFNTLELDQSEIEVRR